MADFPSALPSITNPTANDTLAAVPHHTQHEHANDNLAAIGAKLGTGSSTPTLGTFLAGNGTGTSTWAESSIIDAAVVYGVDAASLDNTSALQSAINEAQTSGRVLLLPPGTLLTDRLAITSSCAIVGAGMGRTTLKLRDSENTCTVWVNANPTFTAGLLRVSDVFISDLTIDGNKANNGSPTGSEGNAIYVRNGDRINLTRVRCTNAKGNGYMTGGGTNHVLTDCIFDTNFANGTYFNQRAIGVDDGLQRASITGCIAYSNGYDGFCSDPGSQDHTYSSCRSYLNEGVGFVVFGYTDGITSRRVTYASCASNDNSLGGYGVSGSTDVTYTSCISYRDGWPSAGEDQTNGWNIWRALNGQAKTGGVVLAGCEVIEPQGNGILINTATDGDVTDGITVADVKLVGVKIRDVDYANNGSRSGIKIQNADLVEIIGCDIRDTRTPKRMVYAIEALSSVTTIVIPPGGYLDTGTTGVYGGASAPASGNSDTYLLVNAGGTIAHKRVTVGASDSGGTGYRLLRVEN